MHLASHLYHVSALACKGFEKFRSGLKEIQPETSRATGGKTPNGLIPAQLTSAVFPQKNTWRLNTEQRPPLITWVRAWSQSSAHQASETPRTWLVGSCVQIRSCAAALGRDEGSFRQGPHTQDAPLFGAVNLNFSGGQPRSDTQSKTPSEEKP